MRIEGSRNGWCPKQMKRKGYQVSPEGKEGLIERLGDFLRSRDEIAFAYVFGSFLEEETFHDIDTGVYLSEIPPEQSTQYGLVLSQTLSSSLRIPVDARVLNFAPASFLYHVIRGKLILERDEEVSAKFTERTIQRYLDLKPLIYRGIKEAFGG
jgi:predicted nucleotidyltransferase